MTTTVSESVNTHRKHKYHLNFGVITVTSTRNENTDESGQIIITLTSTEHKLSFYKIVKDDIIAIRKAVLDASQVCDFVVINGGTGLSRLDLTVDAILPYLRRKIEGFGELFRVISFQQIGAAAMLSRAMAGVLNNTIIFVIPGSPNAVKTALTNLILPEISHIYYELNR